MCNKKIINRTLKIVLWSMMLSVFIHGFNLNLVTVNAAEPDRTYISSITIPEVKENETGVKATELYYDSNGVLCLEFDVQNGMDTPVVLAEYIVEVMSEDGELIASEKFILNYRLESGEKKSLKVKFSEGKYIPNKKTKSCTVNESANIGKYQ